MIRLPPEPLLVMRGVPGLPPPVRALYREAATFDVRFEVEHASPGRTVGPGRPPAPRSGWEWVRHEGPVNVRPVLVPER